jgi:hypothetical protein
MPGILHYLGIHPKLRHHNVPSWKDRDGNIGLKISFFYQNKIVTIYHSKTCCNQYVSDRSRLWVVTSKWTAKGLKDNSPAFLKGYFDGSFLNLSRFPTDASMYLFLWDPSSPDEKGIDLPIE